jgi:hypothetical protein
MKSIDERRLESDLDYRFAYLAEFIGFGDDDIAAVHQSAAHLGPLVPTLVDAVYDKLFGYDCTKRHFVPRQHGYEGEIPESLQQLETDHPMIAFRKQHLGRYLERLVTKPYDASMVGYLDFVGKMHTPAAGSPALDVPLVQMNVLMGFVADALLATILSLELDSSTQAATARAFSKLLWIQNDLITRHYAIHSHSREPVSA